MRCSVAAMILPKNTQKEVLYLYINIKSFFECFIGDFLLQRCNAATLGTVWDGKSRYGMRYIKHDPLGYENMLWLV